MALKQLTFGGWSWWSFGGVILDAVHRWSELGACGSTWKNVERLEHDWKNIISVFRETDLSRFDGGPI